MRLLVATRDRQGDRPGDFCFTVEGELVYLGDVCSCDQDDPDGGCGCGRAFAGLNSSRATTTAVVRDVPLTRADVAEAVRSSLIQAGWGDHLVEQIVEELVELGERWPVGTVVGRRLDDVQPRG